MNVLHSRSFARPRFQSRPGYRRFERGLGNESEHDPLESPKWGGTPKGLGAKHGSLPAIEPEFRVFPHVEMIRNLANDLGFLQASGIPIDPAAKDLIEASSKDLALVCHLLAEIADQASLATLLGLKPGATRLHEAFQAIERTPGGVVQITRQGRRSTLPRNGLAPRVRRLPCSRSNGKTIPWGLRRPARWPRFPSGCSLAREKSSFPLRAGALWSIAYSSRKPRSTRRRTPPHRSCPGQ